MMGAIADMALRLAESGKIPDPLLSWGIARACGRRLAQVKRQYAQDPATALQNFIDRLVASSVAEQTDAANDQHYALPPEFFALVLGPQKKYSCCEWPSGVTNLADAEQTSLETVMSRAQLIDGQRILELGCGWGSLSLAMAALYPSSEILSVSNSRQQGEHIRAAATDLGLTNLEVVTADINTFAPGSTFERIVSVEMFEHVRNYRELFGRLAEWLSPEGRLFVHVFRHKDFAYTFETEGSQDWMARYFFSGGVMPSHGLFAQAQQALTIEEDWQMDGTHYAKTANAWLANLDSRREAVLDVLRAHYGSDAALWLQRWRMFFIACRELFGFADGSEWGVSHYRFKKGD